MLLDFLKIINRADRYTDNTNGGFTLIETLIAITLISLIGIPVFMISSDIAGFSEKIKDLNSWNRELIKLEKILGESVGEVRFPFWTSDIKLAEETGRIRIPYWNGDANLFLELKFEDSVLTITTPEGSRMFRGYDRAEFDLLKDSRLRIIGLTTKVKKSKQENSEFQCTFGAIGREVFNE